jgi:hypothetical protein
MNSKWIMVCFMMAIGMNLSAQQEKSWSNWNWLIGEWKGKGGGQPGQGAGTFSFLPDLDKKVLIRKSHSEYPATGAKPKIVHDDLMVVYLDFGGAPSKAIYFDNEVHTIHYSITYAGKSIVMLSEKMPGVPVFRLTYSLLDSDEVNTKFEISMDGEKFNTYVEGRSKKIK